MQSVKVRSLKWREQEEMEIKQMQNESVMRSDEGSERADDEF